MTAVEVVSQHTRDALKPGVGGVKGRVAALRLMALVCWFP